MIIFWLIICEHTNSLLFRPHKMPVSISFRFICLKFRKLMPRHTIWSSSFACWLNDGGNWIRMKKEKEFNKVKKFIFIRSIHYFSFFLSEIYAKPCCLIEIKSADLTLNFTMFNFCNLKILLFNFFRRCYCFIFKY